MKCVGRNGRRLDESSCFFFWVRKTLKLLPQLLCPGLPVVVVEAPRRMRDWSGTVNLTEEFSPCASLSLSLWLSEDDRLAMFTAACRMEPEIESLKLAVRRK